MLGASSPHLRGETVRLLAFAVTVNIVLAALTGVPGAAADDTTRAETRAGTRFAPATCQGEAITMTGSAETPLLVGTEGRDVIVSNGSDVLAQGGRDLICVTGGSVVIDAGKGADDVRIHQTVDGGFIEGGPGADTLHVVSRTATGWTVDVPAQQISTDEASSALSGFEGYHLGRSSWTALTFVGGAASDVLDLTQDPRRSTSGEARPFDVHLGGGDDMLRLLPGQAGDSESVHGGEGHDAIALSRTGSVARGSVAGSTRHHSFSIDGETDTLFFGFEDLAAFNFARIDLEAGTGPNHLTASGCEGTLKGSSGRDVLRFVSLGRCPGDRHTGKRVLEGGPGNDVLLGSRADDVLRGGAGRDVARGGSGRDRCVAETRLRCEL